MKQELSPTQTKIIMLLAKGSQNSEISKEINMKPRTLYTHLEDIKQRLGIRRRVLLAFYALQKGIITQEDINDAITNEQSKNKD